MGKAMKRRNVKLQNYGSANNPLVRFAKTKEKLREKFPQVNEADLSAFTDWVIKSGHTQEDLMSVALQANNTIRPAVQALLSGHEHVLDQLQLTQGTYTHFNDTAADPNFALRHPGNTELIYRRMTPGDLLMLEAAHTVTAMRGGDNNPAEFEKNYWRELWYCMCDRILDRQENDLHMPERAAATAYMFAMSHGVSKDDMFVTFFDPVSRFYVGCNITCERIRSDDGEYKTSAILRYRFGDFEPLFMAACVLTCYAIDEGARRYMHSLDGFYSKSTRSPLCSIFKNYINDVGVHRKTESIDVNKET